MKILVLSDSHGNNDRLEEVIELEKPFDCLIHCGDVEGAEYMISQIADSPVHIVSGNNDFFSSLSPEEEFDIEGIRFFITHGHYYYVSMGPERIINEGIERGSDVVIFGHTHRPYVDDSSGILVMNPGSIAYPRQEGRLPSYIVLTIDDDGEMEPEIKFLKK